MVSPNSTNIRQTTAQALVSLHRYIPNVTDPQYGVDTCDATSCGTSFRHNTVTLNKAQIDSMIGHLLANNVDANDEFGADISLSGDGNTLAVGAPDERSNASGINNAQQGNRGVYAGAVYLFRRNGGVWFQQAYIKALNNRSGDSFGESVSLSGDGNALAVGARLKPQVWLDKLEALLALKIRLQIQAQHMYLNLAMVLGFNKPISEPLTLLYLQILVNL